MNSSIKRIITLLVIVSSASISLIGLSSIFANHLLKNNQNSLIKVINIEGLSSEINSVVTNDLVRQGKLWTSERLRKKDFLKEIYSQRADFRKFYDRSNSIAIEYPELSETASALQMEYLNFIHSENTIVIGIKETLELKDILDSYIETINSDSSIIIKRIDHITGVLLLRQVRLSKKINAGFRNDNKMFIDLMNGLKLAFQLKSNFLKYVSNVLLLKQYEDLNLLNNLKFNVLPQAAKKIQNDLVIFRNGLGKNDPLYKEASDLVPLFSKLSNSILKGDDSLYSIRKKLSLKNSELLNTRQEMLINVRNIKNQILRLNFLVTKIRLDVLPKTKKLSGTIALTIIILLCIGLLLFVLLGKQIINSIIMSLNKLVIAMSDITNGKRDLNTPVDIPRHTELANLSHSFNHMIGKLEEAKINMKEQSDAYKRFVPEKGLMLLGRKDITKIKLGDFKKYNMSVLFSDIRDFTSITEKMTARESFNFINSYLIFMEPVIEKNNGFIDKYIGDAVMALFPDESGAEDAFNAANEMFEALAQLNLTPAMKSKKPIKIGIGINSGELILGTIGGEFRMEETVIGDTVNLASRMESSNKAYGTEILISNNTYDLLPEKNKRNIREIGTIPIKGKEKNILTYEVYQHYSKAIIDQKNLVKDRLKEAIDLYDSKKYADCFSVLKECHRLAPEDRVISQYLKRVELHLS